MVTPSSALERMIYISRATRTPGVELDMILALACDFCREVDAIALAHNDLLQTAELPFSREILRYPGASRRLSRSQMEKQQGRSLAHMQQRFIDMAQRARFHFNWRGVTADWHHTGGNHFSLVAVGQDDSPWQATVISTLYLLYDDSAAAQRGLAYAENLALRFHLPINILLPEAQANTVLPALTQAAEQLHNANLPLSTTPVPNPDSMAALKTIVAQFKSGLLFLPNNSELLTLTELGDFLTAVHIPVVLVNPA